MTAQRTRAKAAHKGAADALDARRVSRRGRAVRHHRVRRLCRRPSPRAACSPWSTAPDGRAPSRSSSTARRSTPSRAARSATPARSSPRPGAAEVVDTTFALPNLRRHVGPARRGRDHHRPDRDGVDRRRTSRRDPAQPHRHAPAAPRPASGARRARQAGRLDGRARPAAVRLLALRGGQRRPDRRDRAAGQRRDAAQHADAHLRDHQGRGRSARCDRLLR